ncbi:type IV pilus twitching motility protein PilT [Halomonas halocynthiae]|uniref:type IV pilus twitching motility protein PilT n=1 Tax=Halomonas halocynthiae TaxID=176290 RepID=UPI0004023E49|nr:type IV pilus twitching motility protein PilT [Halomonas halocynthiae]
MNITELLTFSAKQSASDMHLSAGMPPMIRVDGELRRLSAPIMGDDEVRDLIGQTMTEDQRRDFNEHLEADFSFELIDVGRFRVNAFHQARGVGAVFRTVPNTAPSADDLGLGEVFRKAALLPRGLVLVTGPTGSGKTTTLAAMINHINTHCCAHILTLEDPIEIVHQSHGCLVNQREVHRHTRSFSAALRSALREDPDVIMIGELRDLETIRLALTAAETGHLVFGTLHTSSAARTIERIVDVFPGDEKAMVRAMLSESLQVVIAQTLLKRKDSGRVAAHEILVATNAVRNLIREGKTAQLYSVMQTGGSLGMQTLDDALAQLVASHVVTCEDASSQARDEFF